MPSIEDNNEVQFLVLSSLDKVCHIAYICVSFIILVNYDTMGLLTLTLQIYLNLCQE